MGRSQKYCQARGDSTQMLILQMSEDHSPSDKDLGRHNPRLETVGGKEDYKKLSLLEDPLKTVQIGKKLGAIKKENLMEYLKRNHDIFA